MSIDSKLIETAYTLCTFLDKQADKLLPQEIAGVVKTHSKLAVASAWVPVPGADVAAGAVTIWTMYCRINSKIGLKVSDNILKTVASGVATNLVSYAAMAGIASSLKFIPGIGSVGGALLMSASLYAITLTAGYVYLEALCLLAGRKGKDFNLDDISEVIKEVLANKKLLKDFFKAAKQSYKKDENTLDKTK